MIQIIGFVAILVAVIEIVNLVTSFMFGGQVNWLHLPVVIGAFLIFIICSAYGKKEKNNS